jgi:hypothetical protein
MMPIARCPLFAMACALIAGIAACGHAGDPPLANRNAAAPASISGVRAIDWRNRSYALTGLGTVAVQDGRAEFALDDDGRVSITGATPASFRVEPPLFADIDGDGSEDAVISNVLGTGGTGQFSSIAVYTMRGGKVVSLGEIPGGDRGDGGIRHVAIERSETGGRAPRGRDGSAVIVDRNVLAPGDGACCASTWQRERWVWRAGQLAEDLEARGSPQPVPDNR